LKAHESDRRKDWVEKTSTDLARRFDVIRVEDLNVKDDMHRQQAVRHLCVERHSGSSDSA
jgi:transposase